MPEFLTLHEAASYLNIPENTLRHYRQCGTGPASFKLGGRVTYELADLEAWVSAERAASVRGGE